MSETRFTEVAESDASLLDRTLITAFLEKRDPKFSGR